MNRWSKRRDQRVAAPRLVLTQILLILRRAWDRVVGTGRIVGHSAERQRFDGPGESGVGLAILGIAAQVEEKVALPSRLDGGQGAGTEPHRHLVTCGHYYQLIVRPRDELFHGTI